MNRLHLLYLTIVFVPLIGEAMLSRRNEARLRADGAREPERDVYRLMFVLYPGAFLAMGAEGIVRSVPAGVLTALGFTIFVGAKLLKYWAIGALGPRWTFRVLVPPSAPLVTHGPYRLLRHPNYIAVMAELTGAMLLVQAFVTGVISLVVFGGLIAARIRVEERALGIR